jgi:hypothetical protein
MTKQHNYNDQETTRVPKVKQTESNTLVQSSPYPVAQNYLGSLTGMACT